MSCTPLSETSRPSIQFLRVHSCTLINLANFSRHILLCDVSVFAALRRVFRTASTAYRDSSCQTLRFHQRRRVYLLRPGGKPFNSFCAPLLSLSWFFSGFLLGSIACWAPPIQTSFFAVGSYLPMTKVPM